MEMPAPQLENRKRFMAPSTEIPCTAGNAVVSGSCCYMDGEPLDLVWRSAGGMLYFILYNKMQVLSASVAACQCCYVSVSLRASGMYLAPTELRGETARPEPTELRGETARPAPTELRGETARPEPTELRGETARPEPTELGGETACPAPTEADRKCESTKCGTIRLIFFVPNIIIRR